MTWSCRRHRQRPPARAAVRRRRAATTCASSPAAFNGRGLRGPTGVALEERRDLRLRSGREPHPGARPRRQASAANCARNATACRCCSEPFAVAVIRAESGRELLRRGLRRRHRFDRRRACWKLDRARPRRSRCAACAIVAPAAAEFYYVAIDYHANVYCSDRGGKLHKFDRELRLAAVDRPRRRAATTSSTNRAVWDCTAASASCSSPNARRAVPVDRHRRLHPVAGRLRARSDPGRWSAVVRYFLTEYAQRRAWNSWTATSGRALASCSRRVWTRAGRGRASGAVRARGTAGTGCGLRVDATPTYSARKMLRVEKYSQPLRVAGLAMTDAASRMAAQEVGRKARALSMVVLPLWIYLGPRAVVVAWPCPCILRLLAAGCVAPVLHRGAPVVRRAHRRRICGRASTAA